jgi:hypothetical protein
LLPWLVVAAVVLLVLEIAGRRLSLWERLAPIVDDVDVSPTVTAAARRRWFTAPQRSRRLPDSPTQTASSPESAEPPAPEPTLTDVLAQAKRQARR